MQIGEIYSFNFEYTEKYVEAALDQISKYEADMGGTEILMPLSVAIDTHFRTLQRDSRLFTD